MQKRVGLLSGGGDCPGINPVIRGIVRKAYREKYHAIGIQNGWKGLITKDVISLDLNSVS